MNDHPGVNSLNLNLHNATTQVNLIATSDDLRCFEGIVGAISMSEFSGDEDGRG